MGRTFQEFYDFFLLAFAFSHGVNGLRQVLGNFVKTTGGGEGCSIGACCCSGWC